MNIKKNACLALVLLAVISCVKKNSFTVPFDGYKLRLEVVSPSSPFEYNPDAEGMKVAYNGDEVSVTINKP